MDNLFEANERRRKGMGEEGRRERGTLELCMLHYVTHTKKGTSSSSNVLLFLLPCTCSRYARHPTHFLPFLFPPPFPLTLQFVRLRHSFGKDLSFLGRRGGWEKRLCIICRRTEIDSWKGREKRLKIREVGCAV